MNKRDQAKATREAKLHKILQSSQKHNTPQDLSL